MKSNQNPEPFSLEDFPKFMELGRMQGTVENGANYATHQQRKSKTNRLKLAKRTKLRHIAKLKRR